MGFFFLKLLVILKKSCVHHVIKSFNLQPKILTNFFFIGLTKVLICHKPSIQGIKYCTWDFQEFCSNHYVLHRVSNVLDFAQWGSK